MRFVTILILSILLSACSEAKVTDPNDPRFDPDKFRFEDYYGKESIGLLDAFRMLFPPGTDKAFVDRVLVDAGEAKLVQSKNYQSLWRYVQPDKWYFFKGPPGHIFVFDPNGKLVNIQAFGANVIYPKNPSYKEVEHEYNDN